MNRALIQRLVSSFDPDQPDLPARVRSFDERVEAGAIGIYQTVTRAPDYETAERKWNERARPKTQENHRAEAEACLRAAGRIA